MASLEDKLRRLDIVFVIDATGSMYDCIRTVRERLAYLSQAIARAPARPNVAFGVVAYRDHPPEDTTFVTQVHAVDSSLQVTQGIFNRLQAEGGGDVPEAVKDGLWDALRESGWREASHKAIVLVGDAPAHERCLCGITFDQICTEAARLEIPIFAVATSENRRMMEQFSRLAERTGGRFVRLHEINQLVDTILSSLQQTVIEDMELSLAVYRRRVVGLDAAEIAKEVGRSQEEVERTLLSLERRGASWEALRPTRPSRVPRTPKPRPPAGSAPPCPDVARAVLLPIENPKGQASYEVVWVEWKEIDWYELQESKEPDFSGTRTAYLGGDTAWRAEGQPPSTYHYRVRMYNCQGRWGPWSRSVSTQVHQKGERR